MINLIHLLEHKVLLSLLVQMAHLGRAPEWSGVRAGGTCSEPAGRTPLNIDRRHQTHWGTSPWSCQENTFTQHIRIGWTEGNKVLELEQSSVKRQVEPHVNRRVSWFLIPTEELRLMTRRSTSFLSRTMPAGAYSGMHFTPAKVQREYDVIWN